MLNTHFLFIFTEEEIYYTENMVEVLEKQILNIFSLPVHSLLNTACMGRII